MRRRMMMGKGLPYDAEVEWIQNSSKQYIMTGVIPPFDAKVEIRGMFGFADTSTGRRFLVSDGNWTITHYCEFNSSNQFGGFEGYIPVSLVGNMMYEASMVINGGKSAQYRLTMQGESYEASTTKWTYRTFGELRLSKLENQYQGTGQIFGEVTILVNDLLVRDMIPVRFTNELGQSEGAMYDRVSCNLFGNAGTGQFILGPDK